MYKDKKERMELIKRSYAYLTDLALLVEQSEPDPISGSVAQVGSPLNSQFGGMRDTLEHNGMSVSYPDLMAGLAKVKSCGIYSERDREIFFQNTVMNQKQKDVADSFGITPVKVGEIVNSIAFFLDSLLYPEYTGGRYKSD